MHHDRLLQAVSQIHGVFKQLLFGVWAEMKRSIKDLELHEAGIYIKNLDDVKDYLQCVISEDNTIDDVAYSIQILTTALERLK